MSGKKACAVVLGVSADLACAAASVMADLRRHSPGLATEVIVQHDGLTAADQARLAAILPTRFVRFKLPAPLRRRLHPDTLRQFTEIVFSKFECFRLLGEYECVIWLDIDQVILRDLAELTRPCESGIKMIPSASAVGLALRKPVAGYDLATTSICASVFVLQQNVGDYAGMYGWCREQIAVVGPDLIHEQPIFDFLRQKFALAITPLDSDVYCCHPRDAGGTVRPAVLHAYGQPKFWNGLDNDQWNGNYRSWLAAGGSPYRATDRDGASAVRKALRRVKRLAVKLLRRK